MNAAYHWLLAQLQPNYISQMLTCVGLFELRIGLHAQRWNVGSIHSLESVRTCTFVVISGMWVYCRYSTRRITYTLPSVPTSDFCISCFTIVVKIIMFKTGHVFSLIVVTLLQPLAALANKQEKPSTSKIVDTPTKSLEKLHNSHTDR